MSSKTTPKQRALVFGLIILGTLFTIFFGMRALHAFKKFDGHRPPPPGKAATDVELIRDWMTISFISNMYRVPEKTLFDALDISPFSNHDKSLKDINQEYYPNQAGYVLELVKTTILAHPAPPMPDSVPSAVPPLTAPAAP
ncbi:MAG: hypothetical protein Q7J80_08205 [Anaerolineales bacterium]|nr:hypothetical protein [Anaerolineales bacterium]